MKVVQTDRNGRQSLVEGKKGLSRKEANSLCMLALGCTTGVRVFVQNENYILNKEK